MFKYLYQVTKENLAVMPDGKSFIRNDAYANIADHVRTSIYAPSMIENMATEYGSIYVLWTKSSQYDYRNTAYLSRGDGLDVAIDVTHADLVTFHLCITFSNPVTGDVFAICKQRIVAQDSATGKPVSWKKVPSLQRFVLNGLSETQVAA